MKIFDLKNNRELNSLDCPLCMILGNFDGVHLGHTKLVNLALTEGARLGIKVGVWTFGTHPMDTLSTVKNQYLTSSEEKNELFASLGVDYVIYEDFLRVRNFTPEEFVEKILLTEFDCRTAVCGFNFKFGKGGRGTPDFLRDKLTTLGRNAVIADAVYCGGSVVSSTSIRSLVEEGRTEEAQALLGRPYSVKLPVVHGKELGRFIGIPTINQVFPENRVRPKNGVYAVKCDVEGKEYLGVANVGSRPTVNSDSGNVNCETHIIDYDGWLYEKTVKISFFRRLRDESRYEGIDALKSAIEKDILAARSYFSKKQGI